MIMPSKYLKEDEALVGVGGILLQSIGGRRNISNLWEDIKINHALATFERFILALDFLFLLGLIDIKDNEIIRVES
jgi:hypothetical protein